MTNRPILSICIPTYNRAEKVSPMVRQILESRPDVQVVVVDNYSKKYHIELLEKITNTNFKLVTREKNIGGTANVADAYSYSDGKYSLLCLDKDYINVDYLGQFLDFLIANPDIVYGQCSLNETQTREPKFYAKGYNSLMAWGYDCHHPTGFFVRNETSRKIGVVDQILKDNNNFAFNTDLIKAHMIMQGDGAYVNIPLMATETLQEAAKERSHTYSGDNIWFFPKNITTRMQLFIADALTLELSNEQLGRIINRIYAANQSAVTVGFKGCLQNESICAHHGIEKRKVGYVELMGHIRQFQRGFLNSIIPVSRISKYRIVFINLLKLSARLVLRK